MKRQGESYTKIQDWRLLRETLKDFLSFPHLRFYEFFFNGRVFQTTQPVFTAACLEVYYGKGQNKYF